MRSLFLLLSLPAALVYWAAPAPAQAPLHIYADGLVNGFQDWSWGTRNLANTSPVHGGAKSISASLGQWEAVSFYHAPMDTALYSSLSFWAHGGTGGGQRLRVYAEYGSSTGPNYSASALPANTWREYVVPLSVLGISNVSNFKRVTLQLSSGTGTFYIDDVRLNSRPAPSAVSIQVDAARAVRGVDPRWFGVNAAIWDGHFDTPATVALLKDLGTRVLRFPGGSLSDEYHWAVNKTGTNTWQWVTSFSKFARVATNVGAQAFITVNYGSGTPAEAAGWVRHSNVTNKFGFKYWEIGNENYGTWETDTNNLPHHAYTYAVRARDYLQQMKAADPTIKVGVVAVPGEDAYHNDYTDHPATNPRTGQTHNGWTPVMLTTLKALGVKPDFLVHHHYPQWTAQESDPFLLQSTSNWARDAADLRQQLLDYYGPEGAGIELVVTENNSNSGDQGKQSTSLVNGIYYADSFGQLAATEFNAFVWWDLRNGTDTKGNFDPLLYGWRTYGDLGMINGLETRHPPYFAAKLTRFFAGPGDTIAGATGSYPLLSAYAARRTNGSLSLLVLNKDTSVELTGQIALSGYVPDARATVRFYGIPQDEAARTNGPAGAQDLATNSISGVSASFSHPFPPLSMTLFSLAPAAPRLDIVATNPPQALVQIHGQPGVPYVIQTSPDFRTWTSVSTNTLTGTSLDLGWTISPGQNYWRALWRP